MGLREELLGIDPDRYVEIRARYEEEWFRTLKSNRDGTLERIRAYPGLAAEVEGAIFSSASYDSGTRFGAQEGAATREAIIGALSLIEYAETAE